MRLYVNKIPKINFCYFWLVCYSVWLKTDSLQKRSKWTNFKSLEICANVVKLFQRFQVLFKFMNLWFYIWNFHQVWMVQNFTLKIHWYFIIDGCWLVTLKFLWSHEKVLEGITNYGEIRGHDRFLPIVQGLSVEDPQMKARQNVESAHLMDECDVYFLHRNNLV